MFRDYGGWGWLMKLVISWTQKKLVKSKQLDACLRKYIERVCVECDKLNNKSVRV